VSANARERGVGLTRCSAALLGLGLLAHGAVAMGQDARRALPDFTVVSPTGAPVGSASLSSEDHWLLVYVGPNCIGCDRLLATFPEWQIRDLAARVVIVVDGDLKAARSYMEPRLTPDVALAWYADADGRAAAALDIARRPALLAVTHGRIQWTLSGALNDPALVEPAIRKWVER
jgi:hypothetical protein